MNEKQKATYLDAESEAGRELAKWTSQFAPGPHQGLLGILNYQMAVAVRENRATLVKDLAVAINAVQKSALQHQLLLGELWSREDRRAFEENLCDALCQTLKRLVPDGWEDAMVDVADTFATLQNEATAKAKIEAPKRIVLK